MAAISSHHTNNSQTLHFGDVETNYALRTAGEVKEGAELLAGYLESHDPDREIHDRRSKMVLGVGEEAFRAETIDNFPRVEADPDRSNEATANPPTDD